MVEAAEILLHGGPQWFVWLTNGEQAIMSEQAHEQGGSPGGQAKDATGQHGVALLLLSAPDRNGLLDALDSLLVSPSSAAPPPSSATPLLSARLAIATPPHELHARLRIARQRIADMTRARLTLRGSGIYLGLDVAAPHPAARRIAFLFPGQGSQHPGMLHELYQETPIVRAWLDALDTAFHRANRPLPTLLIYGEGPGGNAGAPQALFSMEQGAQLSTATNLALFDLIGHLGIRADALVGHSIGEHAAVLAAHAGNADHREAICTELCRLGLASVGMEEPPLPEGMAAVSAFDRAQLDLLVARYPRRLFIAMDNCPHQQVLAGERLALEEAMQTIVAAGGICALLPFVRAYHTPLFDARASKLAEWYRRVRLTPAPLSGQAAPVYSCLTHCPIPTAPDAAAQVMAQQWTEQVNFRTTIEQLYREGIDTFVEVGPDAKLTAFVEDILRGRPHLAVSMLGPTTSSRSGPALRDLAQVGHMLAALFAHGVPIEPARYAALLTGQAIGHWADREPADWARRDAARPAPIPHTPNHTAHQSSSALALSIHRSLIDEAGAMVAATAARMQRIGGGMTPAPMAPAPMAPARPSPPVAWPLLGSQVTATATHLRAVRRFTVQREPFLADHSLGRSHDWGAGAGTLPVLSFTTSLALTVEAGHRLLAGAPARLMKESAIHITDIRAQQWLACDDGALTVQVDAARQGDAVRVVLRAEGRGARSFEERASRRPATPAFQATVQFAATPPVVPSSLLHADPGARPPQRWTAAAFYADYAFHGPSFQGLAEVTSIGANSGEAIVRVTNLPGIEHDALLLDPALLDCAGQLVAFWLLEQGGRTPTLGLFPVSARRIVQQRPAPPPGTLLRCRCRVALDVGGLTTADVAFFTADHQILATFEGFVQRLIEFPPALAACLFGGEKADFSQPLPAAPGQVKRQIDGATWSLLQEGQGIWARLLAQQILSQEERDAWRTVTQAVAPAGSRSGPVTSADNWLLRQLVAKEAVRNWARQHTGRVLPLADINCAALPQHGGATAGELRVHHPALAPFHLHLQLTDVGQRTTATVQPADLEGTAFPAAGAA